MMAFFFEPAGLELDERTLLQKSFPDDKTKAWTALSAALVKADGSVMGPKSLEGAFLNLHQHLGVKRGDFLMLVRVAVTGRTVPPLFETWSSWAAALHHTPA
jgi:hypothetical protein